MIPLRDSHPSGTIPIQTILLIVANAYVFYLEVTTSNLDAFFQNYSLIPALVDLSQPSTLLPFITSMFLHGGLFHILSNMWFLWVFGDNIEGALGWFYLPFYLLGGIVAAGAQYSFTPESQLPIVGASGAVAAVLGAYLVLYPRSRVLTIVPILFLFTVIELPAIVMLGYWFFIQLFNGYAAFADTAATTGGVAWFAHIGGFLVGAVIALLLGDSRSHRREL